MLRLVVHIFSPNRMDLLDEAIPPVKGHHETRSLASAEVWTPVGLPLKFFVSLGPKGDTLLIQTAGIDLLRVSANWNTGGEVQFLLSTEERLRVSVFEVR
jgi:hypothetical protein